jgi:hypothetical protein
MFKKNNVTGSAFLNLFDKSSFTTRLKQKNTRSWFPETSSFIEINQTFRVINLFFFTAIDDPYYHLNHVGLEAGHGNDRYMFSV